ncbi:zinc finger protein, putative [Candida dubliniensis CD36]|uniref:Zinc finger protein, putative n=1 Tax=Candida dubliniensis (strain CD36 / ATCC MYA-646 / CBS 7987 / NCPF 3949 / NRRL Y-17841) TaxID=573826 RepID=B9WIE4_CANDC|nr:zinc finger protein, putative [Candida dubliniensis CD36]CAX41009.1 zinc finger protein, putative [Candida dubliniensis CD36]
MSKRVREEEEEEEEEEEAETEAEENSPYNRPTGDQLIFCNYHPCLNSAFENYQQYHLHVLSTHEHTCESCQKVFPNKNYLSLHIDENHNPLLQIKQERGDKIFKCYTETCKAVFSNTKEREDHLIDVHNYPMNYPFNIVNDGI